MLVTLLRRLNCVRNCASICVIARASQCTTDWWAFGDRFRFEKNWQLICLTQQSETPGGGSNADLSDRTHQCSRHRCIAYPGVGSVRLYKASKEIQMQDLSAGTPVGTTDKINSQLCPPIANGVSREIVSKSHFVRLSDLSDFSGSNQSSNH